MDLGRLRWVGILVPTGLMGLLLLVLWAIDARWAHSIWGVVVFTLLAGLGAYAFSTWVFRLLTTSERRILHKTAQLQALNEAAIDITSELSPAVVLQRVVDRAQEMLGARYCALQTHALAELGSYFLTAGMHPEVRTRIGHPPRGRGLLAVVLQSARALRVRDIARHPAAVGFPPHHPPMHSFLGVPIVHKDRVIGTLYLTEKQDAIEFSREDEEVAMLLANQVAVAIENAQLYERTRRTNEYLRRLIEGSQDAIVTLTMDGRVHLWNTSATAMYGFGKEMAEGAILPMVPAAAHGRYLALLQSVADGQPVANLEDYHRRQDGSHLAVLVALSVVENAFGEAPGVLMIAKDMTAARRLEAQRRRLALLEERERFGRDLHDGSIQSLYAVGLTLEASKRLLPAGADNLRERLSQAAGQLNEVIQDLRFYILDQRPRGLTAGGLTDGLAELTERLTQARIQVQMSVDEKLANQLQAGVATHVLHLAGEAISNVLRHSGATTCRVEFACQGGQVVLEVADNGRGFGGGGAAGGGAGQSETTGGMGLRNMRARSQLLGGDCTISSQPGGGTMVRVEIPMEGAVG